MEEYDVSIKYEKMAQEVIEEHPALDWLKNMRIGYVVSSKDKKGNGKLTLGECIRVKDVYKVFMPYDFIIVMYDRNMVGFSDYQRRIVMHHELLHIGVDESNGEPKYVIIPHDIEDFRTIIDEYGLDWQV